MSRNWEDEVGLQWVECEPNRAHAYVEIDGHYHQPYGIVHGGAWCSMVESVASHGAAAAAQALPAEAGVVGVVGVSNLTDFLRSHASGRVDIVGTPVFVGRSQQVWAVEITRASDGKLVSRGQVRFQNLTTLPADR